MKPVEFFVFCPRCGQRRQGQRGEQTFECPHCGFVYYFNPCIAAAGFLAAPDGRVLFIRRAKPPAQGKLALPGGFIDAGETAEAALRREIREEVNLVVGPLDYLCSHPNEYPYKEVTYPVLDFFFTGKVTELSGATALDGVESLFWTDPKLVNPEELAFPSLRAALQTYLKRL